MIYLALVNLSNEKTGKKYKAGDEVTEKDFPAKVLAHWLKTGKVKVQDGNRQN